MTGAWSRNVAAEELLSLDPGESLIPPELREQLIETAGISPVSLVIAGNFVALPPLPLLALGGCTDNAVIFLTGGAHAEASDPSARGCR